MVLGGRQIKENNVNRSGGTVLIYGARVLYRHTSLRELVTCVSTDRAPVLSSGERDR